MFQFLRAAKNVERPISRRSQKNRRHSGSSTGATTLSLRHEATPDRDKGAPTRSPGDGTDSATSVRGMERRTVSDLSGLDGAAPQRLI